MTYSKSLLEVSRTATRYPLLAYCERCGYEIYSVHAARKFCPVPTCHGYLRHIDRGSKGVRS